MGKVGFLGGTFNPIHYGHLRLAEEARTQFGLDVVLFVPNHIPPHRISSEPHLLEGDKRYCMAVLATLPHPSFLVSNLELKRPGVSYTHDTAVGLKKEYPDCQLFLICGADTLIHHTWHRLGELLSLLEHVLVASRGGEGAGQVLRKHQVEFPQFSSKLGEIRMTPVEISATQIRNRVKNGQSIKNQVPDSVEQFIERYRLYREVDVP